MTLTLDRVLLNGFSRLHGVGVVFGDRIGGVGGVRRRIDASGDGRTQKLRPPLVQRGGVARARCALLLVDQAEVQQTHREDEAATVCCEWEFT